MGICAGGNVVECRLVRLSDRFSESAGVPFASNLDGQGFAGVFALGQTVARMLDIWKLERRTDKYNKTQGILTDFLAMVLSPLLPILGGPTFCERVL
jgi:hypothetical protein